MNAFFLSRGEGPRLENEIASRLQPRGDGKGLCRLAFNPNDITLVICAAYAARRRLCRKHSGSRWPAEVVT